VRLKDGSPTGYALGLQTGSINGHRVLRHSGEVSGYTAANAVFPDDNAAIVVLTNQDAVSTSGSIARKIADVLLASKTAAPAKLQRAREIFTGLQRGKIDRSLFTENANAYFTSVALEDFASSLGSLGEPQEFVQTAEHLRGGMMLREFKATFPGRALSISTFEMPDGKLEQYLVSASN
jgi:D-alanyl-D-alanine carboxypeptidase